MLLIGYMIDERMNSQELIHVHQTYVYGLLIEK